IALPFATPEMRLNYRLLLNRYNETLNFNLVDKAVPNRGIEREAAVSESDQFLVTLDYRQCIHQISAADFPESGQAGTSGQAIHHEPGLWLHMKNQTSDKLDIARLSTIPHGNSVLALGTSETLQGAPTIPRVSGLPVGGPRDLDHGYLRPYQHFHAQPFEGLFDPVEPHKLLEMANQGVDIVKTTKLEVSTSVASAGISNIPFITKQANAATLSSTFWIQELAEKDSQGRPKVRLQYLQVVMLDFFPRIDGLPGLIGWPHVSINTLERVE
ncbi:MAG TPA: heme-binding protein, partial [Polyangiaceae bacterium]|nr:heme-binding protein [Polyangiaceae bacterium]